MTTRVASESLDLGVTPEQPVDLSSVAPQRVVDLTGQGVTLGESDEGTGPVEATEAELMAAAAAANKKTMEVQRALLNSYKSASEATRELVAQNELERAKEEEEIRRRKETRQAREQQEALDEASALAKIKDERDKEAKEEADKAAASPFDFSRYAEEAM